MNLVKCHDRLVAKIYLEDVSLPVLTVLSPVSQVRKRIILFNNFWWVRELSVVDMLITNGMAVVNLI